MAIVIKNAKVFAGDRFSEDTVVIEGDRIAQLGKVEADGEIIDAKGAYIVPGFIDIHIHGAGGHDFCDGTAEAFNSIGTYLASRGVTGFLGTSMAYTEELLGEIFTAAREYMAEQSGEVSVMHGINMEGPFFSKKKKGAQSEKYLFDPDYSMFGRLNELSGRAVKLVDLAPELPGAMDFIEKASETTVVSLAHTEADYDTAMEAYRRGASHLTHLFNAMPPLNHRNPGVIGAAADAAEAAELICDGIHVHPAAVRAAFKLFGRERICLISDAMRACGMPDGEYELGGQPVFVSEGKAILSDGTIAGSSTVLSECVRRAISFGIPPEDAIYCATVTPAKRVGLWGDLGSIEPGKYADIVFLDDEYTVSKIMLRGKIVR